MVCDDCGGSAPLEDVYASPVGGEFIVCRCCYNKQLMCKMYEMHACLELSHSAELRDLGARVEVAMDELVNQMRKEEQR